MIPGTKKGVNNFLTRLQKSSGIDIHYIARGGGWASFGFIIESLLSLISVVAFANLLSKETYGVYKYLISLSSAMGFLTLTGMNTAVNRTVSKGHDGALKFAVKVQLKWNLLFTLAASVLGIYYFVNGNLVFAYSTFILAILSPINAALNTYGPFLTGKKEFKKITLFSIMTTAIFVFLMTATLIFNKKVVVLIAVYSLATFLPRIFFYQKTLRLFGQKELPEEEKKKLLSYGGHLTLVNVFSTISQYIDKVAVFQFLGPAPLAVYSFASVMPDRIKGLLKSAEAILIPKMTDKKVSEIRHIFYKRFFQGLVIGFFLSLSYILLAPIVFGLFMPKYFDSIIYSQVLSLSFTLLVPAAYVSSIFKAHKMMKTIYLSSVFPHLARIILFLVLGKIWGIWGIITAVLLVYLGGTFYNFLLWETEMRKLKKSAEGNQ